MEPVSSFRRLLPQMLAATACNTLLLDLSAVASVSTVVIGELHNSTETISLDDNMASWLGSIPYICEPVGALVAGVLAELLGRRTVMLLMNAIFLLGWILMWTARSFAVLLLASVTHGLAVGLVEAPICSYIGEVCQPEIRGVMGSSAEIFFQLAGLFLLLLGTLTDWRTTAGISALIPVITAMLLSMVPESPVWLLSKGRKTKSLRSLCWLRGWVEACAVQREYDELVRVIRSDTRTGTFLSRVKALAKPSTRRPLVLIMVLMFLVTWSGYIAVRPFMVIVFDKLELTIGSQWSTVIQAVSGLLGAVVSTLLVHRTGKRLLCITGQATGTLCTFLLGAYCYWQLSYTWMPLFLFVVMSFLNSFLTSICFAMICEVFPFKTRSMAIALGSASYYLFTFIASKTYLSIQRDLHLHGGFWMYCGFSAAGVVFMYFQLPETEGRSLYNIEQHFATGACARNKPRELETFNTSS